MLFLVDHHSVLFLFGFMPTSDSIIYSNHPVEMVYGPVRFTKKAVSPMMEEDAAYFSSQYGRAVNVVHVKGFH